jgi:hypothetical protein
MSMVLENLWEENLNLGTFSSWSLSWNDSGTAQPPHSTFQVGEYLFSEYSSHSKESSIILTLKNSINTEWPFCVIQDDVISSYFPYWKIHYSINLYCHIAVTCSPWFNHRCLQNSRVSRNCWESGSLPLRVSAR